MTCVKRVVIIEVADIFYEMGVKEIPEDYQMRKNFKPILKSSTAF
jgi:hypothetical protein